MTTKLTKAMQATRSGMVWSFFVRFARFVPFVVPITTFSGLEGARQRLPFLQPYSWPVAWQRAQSSMFPAMPSSRCSARVAAWGWAWQL